MNQILEDFLINVFFIILPLFIYFLFDFDRNDKKKQQLYIFFSCAIVLYLSMSYPITLSADHIFDLRQIPFILGFLYGGPSIGIILYFILIVYRFSIGGSGAVGAFFDNTILLIMLFVVQRYFKTITLKRKLIVVTIFEVVNNLATIILYLLIEGLEGFSSFLYMQSLLFILQLSTLLLSVYFIEAIQKNALLRETVKKAEKAEVVSQLAASISHEVRNPLTVSRGFIQLLKDGEFPKEKRDEFFHLALQEMDRAKDIITDYLTFAKPALDDEEEIEICKELQLAVDMILPLANMRTILISTNFNCKYPIYGEKQKFHQCFINVLKNCIEAMPDGGTLIIKTESTNESTIVTIQDTGVGMTNEQVARLGEPYFSTKEEGTGLGMMVVFSIIKAMKGSISVSSNAGKGTTFTITFPAVKESREQKR